MIYIFYFYFQVVDTKKQNPFGVKNNEYFFLSNIKNFGEIE